MCILCVFTSASRQTNSQGTDLFYECRTCTKIKYGVWALTPRANPKSQRSRDWGIVIDSPLKITLDIEHDGSNNVKSTMWSFTEKT